MKKRVLWFVVSCFLLVILCAACGKEKEQQKKKPDSETAVSGQAGTEQQATGTSISGTSISGSSVAGNTSLEERSCDFAEQIAGGIMTELWVNLSPELAGQVTVDGLQESWESVAEGAGAYESIESVKRQENDKYQIVLVTMRFRQNQGRSIQFVYNKEEQIAGIWFDVAKIPKTDKREYSDSEPVGTWIEEEITIGRDPYPLTGKITIPEGKKAPVVILLADAADSDMDGTIGKNENKPLRDIAQGLAERGIASVRYNRRSFEYSGSVSTEDSLYDTLFQDVWYAVDQMYNEQRVDRGKIYVLAMGKSADYMPAIVKKKAKRLSGAVMMAAKPVSATERFYSREEKNISSDASYFMEDNSTIPLLMLQGEEDFQTIMNDFEQWKEIWKGRSHIVYHSYQRLNHYFMASSGKEDQEEYDISGKVNQSVIKDIAEWCSETAEKE